MASYDKDHLTFEEQIELLESRGLVVADRAAAATALSMIGYYRFSAYTHLFRIPLRPSARGHDQRLSEFLAGSEFDTVLKVWEFDRRLRLLLLDILERFEVALRTAVAYNLGRRDKYGHLNLDALAPTFTQKVPEGETESPSKWEKWLVEYHGRQESASDEAFVSWFDYKYDGRLPIWVAVEILQWGQLSQLFGGLRVDDREAVARTFGINGSKQFRSWIASMNDVRNFCAHHARLWNRVLVKQASRPRVGEIPALDHLRSLDAYQASRLYPALAILVWMANSVLDHADWSRDLVALLDSFPEGAPVDLTAAGFPRDWRSLPLWQAQ